MEKLPRNNCFALRKRRLIVTPPIAMQTFHQRERSTGFAEIHGERNPAGVPPPFSRGVVLGMI